MDKEFSVIGKPIRDLKFRQVKLKVLDKQSKTFPIKWMVFLQWLIITHRLLDVLLSNKYSV